LFVEREACESERVVAESVGVEMLVAMKVEEASAILIRAAARADVDAPAGCAPVLGGELIRDNLNFFDGFD
jgi:hypothetical protein